MTDRDDTRDDPRDEDQMPAPEAADGLLDLVGLVQWRRGRAGAFDDPRFLAWLAAQGRDALAPDERLSHAQRTEVARRVRADLAAKRAGIAAVRLAVPLVDAPRMRLRDAAEAATTAGHAAVVGMSVAAGGGRELWEATCDRWVRLPEGLPRGRYVALGVIGDSMEPLLHTGDTVLVKLGEAAAPDRVVVAYTEDGGYVVKRVARVTARTIELCSLNAAHPPLVVPRSAHAVLGRVVARWGTRR